MSAIISLPILICLYLIINETFDNKICLGITTTLLMILVLAILSKYMNISRNGLLLILDKKVHNIKEKKAKVDSDSGKMMKMIDSKAERIKEFMNTQSQEHIRKLMNKLLAKRGGTSIPQNEGHSAPHMLITVSECDSETELLDEHNIYQLTTKLLLERGGIPLAREILKDDKPKPNWCICQHCKHMKDKDDNICCKKKDCITEDYHFHSICLDYYVLTTAIVLGHTTENEYDKEDKNRVYRRAAYRLYALWKHEPSLGRKRHPSCVVSTIRYWYPAENGIYTGFKQNTIHH